MLGNDPGTMAGDGLAPNTATDGTSSPSRHSWHVPIRVDGARASTRTPGTAIRRPVTGFSNDSSTIRSAAASCSAATPTPTSSPTSRHDFDAAQSAVVATEFCGTSITSQGRPQAQSDAIRRANPHMRFVESDRRGYVVIDVTATQLTAKLRVVNSVKQPTSRVSTRATYTVRAGTPGARKVVNQ